MENYTLFKYMIGLCANTVMITLNKANKHPAPCIPITTPNPKII